MITSLSIENFKCFKQLQLDNLSRIAVIGGKNNAGKSSLLEAIFFLFSAQSKNLIQNQLQLRALDAAFFDSVEGWADLFFHFNNESKITISAHGSSACNRKLICHIDEKSQMTSPPNQEIARLNRAKVAGQWVQNTDNYIGALNIVFYAGDKEIFRTLLYPLGTQQPESPVARGTSNNIVFVGSKQKYIVNPQMFGRLLVNNQVDDVVDTLRIIEPSIRNLVLVPIGETTEIYADIGLNKKVPLKCLGDGLMRVLLYVSAIAYASKGGIILIDEIENGIHYSAWPKIWQSLLLASKKNNSQIFATTHSYECIQAASEAFKDKSANDFSYLRLDRDGADIKAVQYKEQTLASAIRFDMEVR